MNNFYIFFTFLLFSFTSFATTHTCRDGNCNDAYEVRYIKNKKPINAEFQQILREEALWQGFLQDNPNWFVIFNENNLLPHRAFGSPIPLTNGSNAGEKVLNFLNGNNFTLPVDLRLESSNKNDKHINIHYKQHYNDLEVIDSRLYAKLMCLGNKAFTSS